VMTHSRAHAREKKGLEINGKGREQVEILSTLAGRGDEGYMRHVTRVIVVCIFYFLLYFGVVVKKRPNQNLLPSFTEITAKWMGRVCFLLSDTYA
jgi:hypothetical protein